MANERAKRDWNEVEFLRWEEFRQMAPAIIQLEISRLGEMIESFPADNDFYNSLVKARFELKKFSECLAGCGKESLEEACAGHLRNAIFSLSFDFSWLDEEVAGTLKYILERLMNVHNRIPLIY